MNALVIRVGGVGGVGGVDEGILGLQQQENDPKSSSQGFPLKDFHNCRKQGCSSPNCVIAADPSSFDIIACHGFRGSRADESSGTTNAYALAPSIIGLRTKINRAHVVFRKAGCTRYKLEAAWWQCSPESGIRSIRFRIEEALLIDSQALAARSGQRPRPMSIRGACRRSIGRLDLAGPPTRRARPCPAYTVGRRLDARTLLSPCRRGDANPHG